MSKRKLDQTGSVHTLLIVGVIVIAAVGLIAWRIAEHQKNTPSTSASTTTLKTSSSATPSTTLPAGTDNTSLNNDLSNVSASVNQENADYNSSNSAVNDQQAAISVPTN